MMAYASRTGTRKNLAALRAAGWRLLLSPAGVLRTEGFTYALDNGAWSAYQQNRAFDVQAFNDALRRFGPAADWVAVPDIVMGGIESLKFSIEWLPSVLRLAKLALVPVQDGVTARMMQPIVGSRVGIFVGGSTEWKESSLPMWRDLKQATGCYLHVGRVNTARRIHLCSAANADSFDGTSASRFSKTIGPLDSARRQRSLELA